MIPADDYIFDLRTVHERGGPSVRWHRPFLKEDHPEFLPHFRTGGKVYVRWSEYLQWFERFRVEGNFKDKINSVLIDLKSKG